MTMVGKGRKRRSLDSRQKLTAETKTEEAKVEAKKPKDLTSGAGDKPGTNVVTRAAGKKGKTEDTE